MSLLENADVYEPRVDKLVDFPLSDDVPNVQFSPKCIELELAPGTNPVAFADHTGFPSSFGQEMNATAQIERIIEQGQHFVHMLYTFRSVSRAIPMITDANAPNKKEMNKATFELLRPEIIKIKELMNFQDHVIHIFCTNLQHLVAPDARAKIVPEGLYNALIKIIDLLQKLDNLKDMKSSIQNDFARYKRAIQALRADLEDGDMLSEEVAQLRMFLSNPAAPQQFIFFTLREQVKRISGHEDIFEEMLFQCVDLLSMEDESKERYLTPDERYRLVRAIPHILQLMDGDGSDSGYNVFRARFKIKNFRLKDVQKVIKRYPVVPLYGDMASDTLVILMRCKNWNSEMVAQWSGAEERKTVEAYDLRTLWSSVRVDYDNFIAQFAFTMNEVNGFRFRKSSDAGAVEYAGRAARLVMTGFRYLMRWTCMIMEAASWKLKHPVADAQLREKLCVVFPMDQVEQLVQELREKGREYERAVRYNYNGDELSVMVDMISLVKSLAAMMDEAENKLAPLLRLYIHAEVQKLIHSSMAPMLQRADKKRRPILEQMLQIRRLAGDWLNGIVQSDDYKKPQNGVAYPARVVGPSNTQLYLLRTMVRALYDERSEARQRRGLFSSRDLGNEDVQVFESFHNESFSFPYLLNYSGTLRACSDLGDLWYREFFLEFTGRVQFPIEMSFPWILTEHVIKSQSQAIPLAEKIFYALDVYNDAAHRALYVLNRQYMYDEIEAEVNLVFDQMIFLIADEMLKYFKDQAAITFMERSFKVKLQQLRKSDSYFQPKKRYGIPVAQRHVQLLGRSIDLNALIAQYMNNMIYKDIEACIKRFESGDVSGVYELHQALRVVRDTHELLSQYLELDPFDAIFSEANETVSPLSFKSRIAVHVLTSLVNDMFPNTSYNMFTKRFVRCPTVFKPMKYPSAPKSQSWMEFGDKCSKAYRNSCKLLSEFVGREHLQALVSLLGHVELPLLIEQIMRNVDHLLDSIKSYMDALQNGLPPCKLPKFVYGVSMCYGFFEGKLKPFLEYEDMKPEVFQTLREIGNAVWLLKDLSDVMGANDSFRFIQSSIFLGVTPDQQLVKGGASATPLVQTLSSFGSFATANPQAVKAPRAMDTTLSSAERAVKLHEGLGQSRSLFKSVIGSISKMLDKKGIRELWTNSSPENGVMEVEASNEFHRLWSALNFLFCMSEGRSTMDEEEFGHGFAMAGCLFVHLLGQRHKFELLDFSYHLCNVADHEFFKVNATNEVAKGPEDLMQAAEGLIRNAHHQRSLHFDIFNQLEVSFKVKSAQRVLTFHPPADDTKLDAPPPGTVAVQRSTSAQRDQSELLSPSSSKGLSLDSLGSPTHASGETAGFRPPQPTMLRKSSGSSERGSASQPRKPTSPPTSPLKGAAAVRPPPPRRPISVKATPPPPAAPPSRPAPPAGRPAPPAGRPAASPSAAPPAPVAPPSRPAPPTAHSAQRHPPPPPNAPSRPPPPSQPAKPAAPPGRPAPPGAPRPRPLAMGFARPPPPEAPRRGSKPALLEGRQPPPPPPR